MSTDEVPANKLEQTAEATDSALNPETLLTFLKVLAGTAVLFFVVGFAIVQTYLTEHKLEGMVWLSQEFYMRAGGRFLLDAIKSPFFGAPVFFPLVVLLFFALGLRRSRIQENLSCGHLLTRKQLIKLVGLGVLLMVVILIELVPELLFEGWLSSFVTTRLFNIPNSSFALTSQTVAFFCITLPVLIASGCSIYALYRNLPDVREYDEEDEDQKEKKKKRDDISRLAYHLIAVMFACALVYLPISYGQYIYDWRVTPIVYAGLSNDSGDLLETPIEDGNVGERRLYLLGEFNDKYVFVRTTQEGPEGKVETFVSSEIHRLVFDVQGDMRLSEVIDTTRSEYREAGQQALKEILGDGSE